MTLFEALYRRKCRSPLCWDKLRERRHLGPNIIVQIVNKIRQIREHLQAAQSRQKNGADVRRRPLEFNVGDYVSLKISPTKRVI